LGQDWITFIGRFHPVWVHLPIGFLVLAIVLKAYAVLRKKPSFEESVNFSLALGTLSALIAALLGLLLSQSGGYEGSLLDTHMIAGWSTAVLAGACYWINRNPSRFSFRLNYSLLTVLLIALSVTGHYGGSLTHGEDYLTAYSPFGTINNENPGRVLASLEEAEVFTDVIQPVLNAKCQSCHRAGKAKGQLNLSSYESLLKGGESGPVVIAADAGNSELIRRVTLPSDHDDFMPAEGKKPLSDEEIQLITWWIEEGHAERESLLADADDKLIEWAKPRLNIQGGEHTMRVSVDTAQLRRLENMGIRVRVLSQETGALDVVLPQDTKQASEMLEALLPFKDQIYWLSLAGSGIQDSDLDIVGQFSNLQRLRIENNPITDVGLSALKQLTKLEILNLNGTKVSSEVLKSLAEINSLRSLYLWNTAIGPQDEGVRKLALAEVKVVFGS
jgi:uncharacterized membrane protein